VRDGVTVLSETDRRELLSVCRRRRFGRGDVVFWQGDPGLTIHLVERGSFAARVTTPMGQSIVVNVFRRHDVFGELALVAPDRRRTATVVALEASESLELDRRDFEDLSRRLTSFNRLLVTALARRVNDTTDQFLEAVHHPVEVRVARRLALLDEGLGPDHRGDWIVIRQEDLAEFSSTTRPRVNRVLTELARKKVVELRRGQVRVLDASALDRAGHQARRSAR
jgi:CRP/FNR family transcriptional regulator, cyclic AMP receptor protein